MLHSILAVTSFSLRGSRDNFRVPGVLLDRLQGSLGVSDVSSTRTSTIITGISIILAFFLKGVECENSSRSFFSHNPHTSTSHTRQTTRVPSPFRIYRHINRTHSLPLRTFTTAVSTKNPPPKQKCPIITKDDTFLDEERRYLIVPFILFLFLVTD